MKEQEGILARSHVEICIRQGNGGWMDALPTPDQPPCAGILPCRNLFERGGEGVDGRIADPRSASCKMPRGWDGRIDGSRSTPLILKDAQITMQSTNNS